MKLAALITIAQAVANLIAPQPDLNPEHASTNAAPQIVSSAIQSSVIFAPAAATISFLPVSALLSWSDAGSNVSFNLYYGTCSSNLSTWFSVGTNLTALITNLTPFQTYYFAVTAVSDDGTESDKSVEWSDTPPAKIIRLHFPENTVGIQSSPDMVNWSDRPDAIATNGDWLVSFSGSQLSTPN